MVKYKDVRAVVVDTLGDQKWHTVDELQVKCEDIGIKLEGKKGPIYNVTYQLRKKGEIEANGTGEYRLCKKNIGLDAVEETLIQGSNYKCNESLMKSIENIELYLKKYKKFDWINCSESDLQEARINANKLINLAKKIRNEFEHV